MARKERGVIRTILKHFINSFKPKYKDTKLVGEDFYGTKYYESSLSENSSRKLPARYFKAVNKDDYDQEMPAEWEAWLRHRRKEPPTPEEVERNYLAAVDKKRKAAEIEDKFGSADSKKYIDETGKKKFPTYTDYKND